MAKTRLTNEDLKSMQGTVIVLHGVFDKSFFDVLKKRMDGRRERIFVCEGRPGLEAAKTAVRELPKRKITPTLIADNMAGFLFYKNLVKEIWLAYDASDRRGAFCYIGASILALLAKEHDIPVFCYPSDGQQNLLGREKDLLFFDGKRVAPAGTKAYVPLREWVPGSCFVEASHGSK